MWIDESLDKVQLLVDKILTVIAPDQFHGYVVDDTEDWSISGSSRWIGSAYIANYSQGTPNDCLVLTKRSLASFLSSKVDAKIPLEPMQSPGTKAISLAL